MSFVLQFFLYQINMAPQILSEVVRCIFYTHVFTILVGILAWRQYWYITVKNGKSEPERLDKVGNGCVITTRFSNVAYITFA